MGKHNRGFVLLDVLLSILVLTAGSVFLLQAVSGGLFAGGVNETEFIAVTIACDKMESVRNTAYAGIVNEAKAAVAGFPFLQRQVAVTIPQTGLKQITVSVYYTVKSSELNISMVTYVSDT